MSGSTARKVQPFTISTRLSLPKCAADFSGDACPGIALASALDSHRGLRRSINERISLYLAHARAAPRSPSPADDGGTDEERLNRSSLARSIKKITLSNWYGDAGTGEAGGPGDPARAGGERNHNNNNSRTGKAQFKVFLRKDVDVEEKQQEPGSVQASVFCSPVDRCSPFYASWNSDRGFRQRRLPTRPNPKGDAVLPAPSNPSLGMGALGATKAVVGLIRNLPHGPSIPSPGSIPLRDTKEMLQMHCLRLEGQQALHPSPVWMLGPVQVLAGSPVSSSQKESPKGKESAAAPRCSGRSGVGAAPLLDLSPLIAQFNREMLQAESWVRGKLRDLKDGCDLQDWEEVAQTLQRDMKDFENTLIKLNQMGEQLMWRASPSAEAVRRQLLALQDQWQLLKQTAASQSKALGGLRSLQDFNRKAERLEAWIKHKEEKPSLAALLQESPDKIQLTRRILDLKQEEQQFQSLHKELNSLAQKLEKQGKSESRNISARRKHLNKMWLRLQGTLKEHHEALQLALEVASFLQQADILLGAIHTKQSSICSTGKPGEGEPCQDRDVRDIASQVMMLDVTVSQLLNLQPSLAARVTSKHRDVKESWAQLQQALRTGKAPARASSSPGGKAAAPNVEPRGDDSSRGAVGKEAAAKWTRGVGGMVPKDVLEKKAEHKKGEESSPCSPAVGQAPHGGDNKRRREAEAEWGMQQPETQVQDVCQVVNARTLSPYKDSVGVPPCPVASLEAARMQQEPLSPSSSARAVLLEGPAAGRPPGSPQVEAMLRELGELWEDLQRKHQENGIVLQEIDKALRLVGELDQAERWLQDVAGSLLEPAAMRSPEELRQDLEEISQLEKQLLLCGLKLQALREEAAGESPTEHEGTRKMQRKVEMVEEKLAHVQAALRHRAADLRDSLVLSEFLQDLQEEEARSQQGSAAAEKSPSSEDMSRPLGELQEAVEMLNDVAKERERVMEVAAETENLERLVAKVSPQLKALQSRAKALSQDIALAENSFTTVKSEKDLQGLQGLLSRQQEMEHAVSQSLQGQLEELERAAARLQELCPAGQCPLSRELQETLRAWAGLRELLRETRLRVQQASQLRRFFKDYLAMISWTEDTRARIFSESPSSSSLPETSCEELERRIEEKLKEFEALEAAGQQLVSEEHYLSATIKERLEELQSMLGWVLVRWRAQRHQQDLGSRQEDRRDPESLSSTSPTGQEQHASHAPSHLESIHSPVKFMPCSLLESVQRLEPNLPEKTAISPPTSPLSDAPSGVEQSWGQPSSKTPRDVEPPKEAASWDPAETSMLLLPPRGPCGLGETVSLILSIGKKGEKKKAQLLASSERPGEEALPTLPATKHSSCKTFWKRCQGLLGNTWGSLKRKRKAPHQLVEEVQVEARKSCSAKRPPAVARRPAARSGGPAVSHTLPKAGAGCLFPSLQRREQARAEQARLLTLRGIMGDSSLRPAPEQGHGPSHTWPQKCGWRKGGPAAAAAGPQLGELLLYVRNPLVQDIDAECGVAPQSPHIPSPKITCPRVSLGSVLSLELPRDAVALGCRRGAAARQQEAEGREQRQDRGVRPWKPTGTHGVGWQEDGHSPQRPNKRLGVSPKSEQETWLEEVSFKPSYSQRRAHCAGKEHRNLQHPGSTSRDLLDLRPSQLSRVAVGDELATRSGQDDSSTATGRARHHRAAWLQLGSSPASIPGRAGASPSPACAQQPASSSQPRASPASPAAPTQLSVFEWALGSAPPQSPALGTREVCHPAHRQFEEEEEELQAIWDGAQARRAQSPPGGSCASHGTGSRAGSLPSPSASAGGPLILSSANNVLVAKFSLPTTAQLLHSPSGEKSPGVVHSGSGSPDGLRVSSHVEELVSAAPVDASSAWDQRRHGQEERESSKVLPGKMEFQMMEGTLERKHVLQTGGRKASCRAWGLFHAVLMRQTLCFYQDRRDSLKSSVVALPLNLSGAVCTPDAEYTKKTNCFRLQLQDGSEYLLRAPTQTLMNEWVSKLQQNSGFPEVDYFQAAARRVEGTAGTGSFSKVSSPGSSHLQGHHQVTTTQSQEVVVLPCPSMRLQRPLGSQDSPVNGTVAAAENAQGTGHKEQQWSPRASPGLWDNICPEDDCGLVANRRRSYSFTSATYQKITPLAVPREAVEAGSSYSVTLYIGEQVSVPRARCHSFVAQTGSARDTRGDKTTSPPRTKNKSVFKKFFGKKE